MNKNMLFLEAGTYQPISKAEVKLPRSYNICSEEVVAARQVKSMFATVWSDLNDAKVQEAQKVLDSAHENKRSEEERLDSLAEEFSSLRD